MDTLWTWPVPSSTDLGTCDSCGNGLVAASWEMHDFCKRKTIHQHHWLGFWLSEKLPSGAGTKGHIRIKVINDEFKKCEKGESVLSEATFRFCILDFLLILCHSPFPFHSLPFLFCLHFHLHVHLFFPPYLPLVSAVMAGSQGMVYVEVNPILTQKVTHILNI